MAHKIFFVKVMKPLAVLAGGAVVTYVRAFDISLLSPLSLSVFVSALVFVFVFVLVYVLVFSPFFWSCLLRSGCYIALISALS